MRKLITLAGAALSMVLGGAALAQDAANTPIGPAAPKVSYGPYVRFEANGSWAMPTTGSWQSPGYPKDPEVFFDVPGGRQLGVSGAFGFDMANGFRAELAATRLLSRNITAPWSYTVPTTPGPHATMAATVKSTAVMANAYYEFDFGGDSLGGDTASRLSAFVTGGIGLSWNEMSDWTRTNAASIRPVRVFEGKTTVSPAWNIGAGLSYDISPRNERPVFLDVSYRYMALGNVSGSATPLPGNGNQAPVQPFNFNVSSHVIGVGIRIPINRY